MVIQHFFEPETFTLSYVVYDNKSGDGLIIDPVLDFDPASGEMSDRSLQEMLSYIREKKIAVRAILETHAHADHLSGSQLLKQHFPQAKLAIGARIKAVQQVFKRHLNLDYLQVDASQFDQLFADFEEVEFGTIQLKAIPTPGHTPACMSYLIGDALFTGDALFMPDYGTGRCDFPQGSAQALYNSITKNIYTLPDSTRVFVGHDYSPNGRVMKFETTVGESKTANIQLKASTSVDEYVKFREARDKTLKAPRLLYPSIQVNVDGGRLPPHENNDVCYLKTPVSLKLKEGKL